MLEIKGETVRCASKCPYEFGCLGNWDWDVCPTAGEPDPAEGVPVKPVRHGCTYLCQRGGCSVCQCPVRAELVEQELTELVSK
jgi:hypothetical protein